VGIAEFFSRLTDVDVHPIGAVVNQQDDVLAMQVPRHSLNPARQVTTHEPLLQLTVPLLGATHVVHEGPQALTPLARQTPPHSWKPALHAMPHEAPLQVALPLAGTAQGVHRVPQEFTLLLAAHRPPQL
jgi:hypothetical protein